MSERRESGLTVGARFSLVYAALFLQVGVALPFFPVVIAGQGLSPSRLVVVLAAIAGARTIVTPLLGFLSDRFRLWREERRTLSPTGWVWMTAPTSGRAR